MDKKKFTLEQLFQKPLFFIAAAYPYLLIIIVGLGLYYIWNINPVFENTKMPLLEDRTITVAPLTIKEPSTSVAFEIEQVQSPSLELITKGDEVYTNTCQSCHGPNGQGDGPAGVALNPPPRNFTSLDGWVNGPGVVAMYKTLQEGIPGGGMAAYDYFATEDKIGAILHIRTFMPDPPEITDETIAELDEKYNLSQGMEIPGQIPFDVALSMRQRNDSVKAAQIGAFMQMVLEEREMNPNIQLFCNVVDVPEQALRFLQNSGDSWRSSPDALTALIERNIIRNGFNAGFLSLKGTELTELHTLLTTKL